MTMPRLPKPDEFTTTPSPAALAYAGQFLKYKSILRRADTMVPNRVDGIIKHVTDFATWMAVVEGGEADWISRALNADDMPGSTTREWNEATGTTTETFVAAALGDGTAIADDTFIGIYGCQFLAASSRLLGGGAGSAVGNRVLYKPPVTSVRFTVGGTRVAEWDLYTIWRSMGHQGPNSTATEKLGVMIDFPIGIAESPIFIGKQKTLLVEYYEQVPTTITDFVLMFLGIVVEKRGGGLAALNP